MMINASPKTLHYSLAFHCMFSGERKRYKSFIFRTDEKTEILYLRSPLVVLGKNCHTLLFVSHEKYFQPSFFRFTL